MKIKKVNLLFVIIIIVGLMKCFKISLDEKRKYLGLEDFNENELNKIQTLISQIKKTRVNNNNSIDRKLKLRNMSLNDNSTINTYDSKLNSTYINNSINNQFNDNNNTITNNIINEKNNSANNYNNSTSSNSKNYTNNAINNITNNIDSSKVVEVVDKNKLESLNISKSKLQNITEEIKETNEKINAKSKDNVALKEKLKILSDQLSLYENVS